MRSLPLLPAGVRARPLSVVLALVALSGYTAPLAADDAAPQLPASEQTAKPGKELAAIPGGNDDLTAKLGEPDYYEKRARIDVEADRRRGQMRPHALAIAHPEADVVVCDAGCPTPDGRSEIVFQKPKARTARAGARAVRVNLPPPARQPSNVIACVAGCYEGAATYRARLAPAPLREESESAATVSSAKARRGPFSPIR